jgi:hypothetical protein
LSVLQFWLSGNGIVCFWSTELKKKSNIYVVKGRNLTSENDSLCAYWIRPLIVAQNRLGNRVILLILGLCIAGLASRPIDWYSVIWPKWIGNYAICCDMIPTWKTRPKKWYQYILDKIETIYFLLFVCCWYLFDYIISCICICGYLISDTWFLVNPRLKLNIALRNFISHDVVLNIFIGFGSDSQDWSGNV